MSKFGRPEIFNTDQGSQFSCQEWTQTLKNAGVAISMDGKGASDPRVPDTGRGVLRGARGLHAARRLSHDVEPETRGASDACGARLRCGCTIGKERTDQHHQPPQQIHSSQREICPKKRSHPWLARAYCAICTM